MCNRTNIDSPFIVVYTIKKDTNGCSLENGVGMKLPMHTQTLMHFWYPNNKNEKITNLILH